MTDITSTVIGGGELYDCRQVSAECKSRIWMWSKCNVGTD